MDDDAPASTWSPANNPYSIAVSEAQWWLTDACKRFDQAVPGLADARDVLVHFDDYACGKGKLSQREPSTLRPHQWTRAAEHVGVPMPSLDDPARPAARFKAMQRVSLALLIYAVPGGRTSA